MPRFVLRTLDGTPLGIAEAPTKAAADLHGWRHVPKFFSSIVEADFRQPREQLRASFEARYLAEGVAPDAAKAMAVEAAGPEPFLPLIQVPKQPSRSEGGPR